MSAGHQAAFDGITTLVASTASLLDDNSGIASFVRAPSRLDLIDQSDASIHRQFHVIYDGSQQFGGTGGSFSGSVLDDFALFTIQIGYYEGGGDISSVFGERHSIDRVAMDDLDRVRQHIMHPNNFNGLSTGICNVEWTGTSRLAEGAGTARRIYQMTIRVWIRHSTLS